MNIDAYLERINYHGALAPTAEVLGALHVAHLLAVPFENLSIHANQPIVLDDEALFSKIVEERRGGFCYEANGLFAALLRALGFQVAMLAAGVANDYGDFGPEFDHLALLVTLEQRWLVDVGFGDSFRQPLRLDEDGEQWQGDRAYRLIAEAPYRILMQGGVGESWTPQYRFTLQTYGYSDFEEMCLYHQTSPQSPFTQRRICTRATAKGRVTLSDMRLIIATEKGQRQEQTLTHEEDYATMLREHFGIIMRS